MTPKRTARSRSARAAVKTTLNLPAETSDALRELAADRNTTLAEVIRRAVSIERFLHETRKAGGKVLVEDVDKKVKELVIF